MCKRLLFLISFVVVFGLVTNAFATTRHVKQGGPPHLCPYDGIWFETIESAYAASSAGDTITVHKAYGGAYGDYTIGCLMSDDSKHDITIDTYGCDHVIVGYTEVRYKTGLTIDGLVFYNPTYEGLHYTATGNQPKGYLIKNCIFYTQNKGLNCNNTSGDEAWNWTVENCTFLGTGDGAFGNSDGIRCKYYAYDWTVKDCIFQSIKHWDDTTYSGTAVSISTGNGTYADYCSFYDNARDVSGPDGADAWYGTNVTTNIQVLFASTNIYNPKFLYLLGTNDASILTGDSDSSYRGARPTPEPATIAPLGLGGLALLRRKR